MTPISRRPTLIQQIYGYAVCLITIVVALIAVTQLVNAAFDLSRPAQFGRYGYEPGAATFEQYRVEHGTQPADPRTGQPAVTIPDSTLRRAFDEDRAARVAYAHWDATKSLVTHSLLLIVAVVLFVMHWRWLRATTDDDVPATRATA